LRQARPDYEAILVEAIRLAKARMESGDVEIVRQIVYSISRKRALGFEQVLSRLGYEVRNVILKSRTDSFDWDTQLAVDAVRDAVLVDLVIIVSGDGDVAPILQAVREQGADVQPLHRPPHAR
jgi:uncharacterized LabA/DUF88 family protein